MILWSNVANESLLKRTITSDERRIVYNKVSERTLRENKKSVSIEVLYLVELEGDCV